MFQYSTPVPGYWEWKNTQHAAAVAAAESRHVEHAELVLDGTQPGERVVFEGGCPSGSTFWGETVSDGTPECRERILADALRFSWGRDDGWLVRTRDVSGAMDAADMRTG